MPSEIRGGPVQVIHDDYSEHCPKCGTLLTDEDHGLGLAYGGYGRYISCPNEPLCDWWIKECESDDEPENEALKEIAMPEQGPKIEDIEKIIRGAWPEMFTHHVAGLMAPDFWSVDVSLGIGETREDAIRAAANHHTVLWRTMETAPSTGITIEMVCKGADGTFFLNYGYFHEHLDSDGEGWTDGTVASWGSQENIRLNPMLWRPVATINPAVVTASIESPRSISKYLGGDGKTNYYRTPKGSVFSFDGWKAGDSPLECFDRGDYLGCLHGCMLAIYLADDQYLAILHVADDGLMHELVHLARKIDISTHNTIADLRKQVGYLTSLIVIYLAAR
ncbi:hypothetical protein FTO74_14240 [Granulicella sp. WH15]|uniref:hypothetical protein n=1 Tax=Granulicella sp. WH15 TaxID=2602070 RepID=UPI00136760AB|nr:hypothetical protein [Granulicella sp. WH15]QHN04391.1 hypothetical protein FTO74_14240 [Granulicella sp. WH15]